MAGTTSIMGLGSGLPADLVDQLVNAQRTGINRMTTQMKTLENQKSAFSDLESRLRTFQGKAAAMQTVTDLMPRTVTSSDEEVLKATVSTDALTGSHTITVDRLAQYDSFAHAGVASLDTALTSGAGNGSFTVNGNAFTVTAGQTTMRNLVDAINADTDVGVRASVVNDNGNYRMVLTAKDAGAGKISGISFNNLNIAGFGGSSVDAAPADGFADSFSRLATGQESQITVDGLAITGTSNTFDEVVPGMTLEAKKVGANIQVTVSNDSSKLKEKIQTFLDGYNEIRNFIKSNSDVFQGEASARSILNNIQKEMATRLTAATGSYSSLAEIGVKTDYKTGEMSLDATTFDKAVANDFSSIAEVFSSEAGNKGVAWRVDQILDNLNDRFTGVIQGKVDGLESRVQMLQDTIAREETRLEKVRDTLTKQFANLDALVNSMNQASTALAGLSRR